MSEWVSGRPLGSVHPTASPACLQGAGEQDERALAIGEAALGLDHPTVAAVRGSLEVVLQALKDAPPRGSTTVL